MKAHKIPPWAWTAFVAVAVLLVAALVLCGGKAADNFVEIRRQRQYHGDKVRLCHQILGDPACLATFSSSTGHSTEAVKRRFVAELRYHQSMLKKWHDAARYPWLPVAPDPPPPK